MTDCFRCGDSDHLSYDCPSHTSISAAPAAAPGLAPALPTYIPPPPAPMHAGVPPTDEYYQAKIELGLQAVTDLAGLLSVPCPWCGASKGSICMNRATGRRKDLMHEARYAAALRPLPPHPAGADKASQQVSESRATRTILP